MGARGDTEREIATEQRELAARALQLAKLAHDPASRWDMEQLAKAHQETAMLHDRLADMYDREDGA